jgi:electron transfer flavoprotein alpha subunit
MRRMEKTKEHGGVWVFADYRNYFQNRVTLQLIAKGKQLAEQTGTGVTAVLLGQGVHQYAMEYVAHGADAVMVGDHPYLKDYCVEAYTAVLADWAGAFGPDILLAGATSFGREFFPRLAKRLRTGLSADCVALEMDPESGLLMQTTPSFGGELLADVVTPDCRPQMATVHPGVFRERPHDAGAMGRIIYPRLELKPETRLELLESVRQETLRTDLEDAEVVVAGGMGLGSKERFRLLHELADLLEGEVGATRPAIRSGWAEEDRLLGQTGKSVKPKLLISIGTSGALQYTTGIQGAETIIAINRDPNAPIFRIADLGLVGDANMILPILREALRKRL